MSAQDLTTYIQTKTADMHVQRLTTIDGTLLTDAERTVVKLADSKTIEVYEWSVNNIDIIVDHSAVAALICATGCAIKYLILNYSMPR